MTNGHDPSWLEKLTELKTDPAWSHWGELPVGRTLLSRLRSIILSAPERLRTVQFQRWTEDELEREVRRLGPSLDKQDSDFWAGGQTPEEMFDLAVVAARYVDEQIAPVGTPVLDPGAEGFLTEDRTYVVPSRRYAGSYRPMQSHPISKRLLLHHRVLPVQVNGRQVRLHIHGDLPKRRDAHAVLRNIVCAIFPDMSVVLSDAGEKGFAVTGLQSGGDMAEVIRQQYDASVWAKCDTIVWPELTMPPKSVTALVAAIGLRPLDSALPPVIAAGSWHVDEDGKRRNRGLVLDGRGRTMLTYDKNLPFFEAGSLRTEAIDSGEEIHAVVTEHELIVFLICRDFCDQDRLELIKDLDASYVLVPSMGSETTFRASLQTAAAIQTAAGTLTAVAQQVDQPTLGDVRGYVIPAPRRPQELVPAACETDKPFTSFYAGK